MNDSVGAPTTWVLSNHDVVRHVSRLGLDSDGPRPNGIRAGDTIVSVNGKPVQFGQVLFKVPEDNKVGRDRRARRNRLTLCSRKSWLPIGARSRCA